MYTARDKQIHTLEGEEDEECEVIRPLGGTGDVAKETEVVVRPYG